MLERVAIGSGTALGHRRLSRSIIDYIIIIIIIGLQNQDPSSQKDQRNLSPIERIFRTT